MTLQDLGALGEFLGFFAVAVTLIFLSLQMRQSSRLQKAQIHQALRGSSEARRSVVLQNKDVMSAVVKARTGVDLTDEETWICAEYYGLIAQNTEFYYILFEAGAVDKETLDLRMRFLMESIDGCQWATNWWSKRRPYLRTNFVEHANLCMESLR